MLKTKGSFKILDRSVGMNGPSLSLGALSMIIGVTLLFIGLGLGEIKAFLSAMVMLALAVFLIFSINCIAVDRTQNQIWLYKDLFFTTPGEKFSISEFRAVCIYYEITGYNVSSKSFSVALISKADEKVILKECGNINPAKKLLYLVASETGLYMYK